MVSELWKKVLTATSAAVLILVLMEYGLWVNAAYEVLNNIANVVLILVLMEYGLWEDCLEFTVIEPYDES